jgi:hypothetical protein
LRRQAGLGVSSRKLAAARARGTRFFRGRRFGEGSLGMLSPSFCKNPSPLVGEGAERRWREAGEGHHSLPPCGGGLGRGVWG